MNTNSEDLTAGCIHRVVCAAVRMNDGNIITGVRHLSPDMRVTLLRLYGDKYHTHIVEQGFIDNKCHFLTRGEAASVASAYILGVCSDELFSEDLY